MGELVLVILSAAIEVAKIITRDGKAESYDSED